MKNVLKSEFSRTRICETSFHSQSYMMTNKREKRRANGLIKTPGILRVWLIELTNTITVIGGYNATVSRFFIVRN